MGQIKYFPIDKCKKLSFEEKYRLRKQQDMITGARNEMMNRIAGLPRYWQAVEKSLFHERFKSRIKLLENFQRKNND